jgi:transposase-like protein
MTRQVNQVHWDKWRQRIKGQRESGLSIAAFCRREDISAPGFYVWRRKLRQAMPRRQQSRVEAGSRHSRQRGAVVAQPRRVRNALTVAAAPTCPTDFLPLPVRAAQAAPWIELVMADGTILRLPQQNLAALITALRVLRGEPLELPCGEGRHA